MRDKIALGIYSGRLTREKLARLDNDPQVSPTLRLLGIDMQQSVHVIQMTRNRRAIDCENRREGFNAVHDPFF